MLPLNKGQEEAKAKIIAFLFNPKQKYFCLDAMPGMGKTFLLNTIKEELENINRNLTFLSNLPYQSMLFGAPTNKAAGLISGISVHKLFKLSLFPNYKTGKMVTKVSSKTVNIGNSIVVIDEASMLSPTMLGIIDEFTKDSKVIFSMDSYQLAPIGYDKPIIATLGYQTSELLEPMRFKKDSHIFQQCLSLRQQVIDGTVLPFVEGEGISIVDAKNFKEHFLQEFSEGKNARILCYTNDQVELLNGFVRKKLHGNDMFVVGDPVVAASAKIGVSVEDNFIIHGITSTPKYDGTMDTYTVELDDGSFHKIPANKRDYFALTKRVQAEAKRDGDWSLHFQLAESYLDIRDAFACTVDKSQGSTYETAFLDYPNMVGCSHDISRFTRMRNVSISRASKQVVIYNK